jgi:hypothetical protein
MIKKAYNFSINDIIELIKVAKISNIEELKIGNIEINFFPSNCQETKITSEKPIDKSVEEAMAHVAEEVEKEEDETISLEEVLEMELSNPAKIDELIDLGKLKELESGEIVPI